MTRSFRLPAALLLAASVALAVPALALAIHFEKESLATYQGQLSHHQVHVDSFHPGTPTGHLHISLTNGGHATVAYTTAEQGKLVAQAQGDGVRVKVATLKTAKAAAVHHKLRYIAGGILIVVILIVLIVLLIGRRRTLAEEGRGEPSGASGESG